MNILVAGGAGFIGSNFIRYWMINYPEDKIYNFDKLTYAGTSVDFGQNNNYEFIKGSIGDYKKLLEMFKKKEIDIVVNFTAESHIGRALVEPGLFVKTNVLGVQILLEAIKEARIGRFYQVSSCEVYGDMGFEGAIGFNEKDPYRPITLYSASKACSNIQIMAYRHTFSVPALIGHCSNNYGPYQFPEKMIPRFITNAILNKELPLFKSSNSKREWLHVDDHCRAIEAIIKTGKIGETYNIGSGVEKSIEEIADMILDILGKPRSLKAYVEDRPLHDKRYLLDSKKIRDELGWRPEKDFEKGLMDTVKWYADNKDWWKPLLNKGYMENYKKI